MPTRKHTNKRHSQLLKNKLLTTKKQPTTAKEFEGRVLDLDLPEFYKKLKTCNATKLTDLSIYRRSVFKLCDIKRGFVRVRDEGDKITMTSKIYKDPKFPIESELSIHNTFEHGQDFLRSLNLDEKAYHETMREKWSIPKSSTNKTQLCEVAIDRIPGLPVYAELECKTETDLKKTCKLLGVTYNDLGFGGYGNVYQHYYGIASYEINNVIPKLTFNNIRSELDKYIDKNRDILENAYKTHLKIYKTLKKT
jgi:adenylate cyclase class IV